MTIFRRIDARKILIPAFQRTFVWDESQVLDLLESVYSGYPVGSILLWNIDKPILKVSDSDDVPFPKGKPQFPADFVLDGLQRLSTLYGVFHYGSVTKNSRFSVGFDLRDRRFAHSDDAEIDKDYFVSLNALFNPRALLDVQQRLFTIPNGEELVQTVLSLQSRFQDYMLPLVTLAEKDPSQVVSIFERVNSTGTKQSRVDFMRAITWSSQFDLNEALDEIGSQLREKNFDIADDTIVKAIGLNFGLDPVPDIMLKLREKKASDLSASIRGTEKALNLTIDFLRSELHILGSDYVPYEGQLLTLFNVFRHLKPLNDEQRSQLKHWFFTVSFAEALQGRPDHFVARLIKSVTQAIKNSALERPLLSGWSLPDESEFLQKRMIRGKALSTAFVSLLGELQVKSIADGRDIPADEYLRTFDIGNFVPIFSKQELPKNVGGSGVSARVFANVVLIPPSDAHLLRSISIREMLNNLYDQDDIITRKISASQLLPESGRLLRKPAEFLEARGAIISKAMRGILEGSI